MLTHPTHEALSALKLDGMAEAFAELLAQDSGRSLDPVAWIGLMLDREQARRGTRRFQSRLRAANLRHGDACMENVDYRTPRGLDRALFQSLGGPGWIDRHRSVLFTGPCGVGKSWLACALGHDASRADRTVLYHRLPRLFSDLELARGDGRFDRLFRKIARVDLLILDDWGPDRLTAPQRRDLMEIVEERYGSDPDTTNNRMELTAMAEGLAMIPAGEQAEVYSDSRLVVQTLTGWAAGWERRGWKRADGEVKSFPLTINRKGFIIPKETLAVTMNQAP